MQQPSTASGPIPQAIASLTLGPPVEYGSLRFTPLIADDEAACEYLALDEALAAGLVQITEVSETGSVPELRVTNRAATPVLIIDGEELVGAKQNRVINLTVLVAAQTTMTIPVSCVEAGRWRNRSSGFAAAPHVHFASGRAAKTAQVTQSLVSDLRPLADQSAVWAEITAKASRMEARSDTDAMSAIFERHAPSVDAYVARLGLVDRQRGAIFSVHGRTAGLELFDWADTCRRLMPKLIRSYAIDAVEAPPDAAEPPDAHPATWLEAVAAAQGRVFSGVGEGATVRLEGQSLVAAALVVGDRLVHLVAFAVNGSRRPHRRPIAS